jgi:hypothetical protein
LQWSIGISSKNWQKYPTQEEGKDRVDGPRSIQQEKWRGLNSLQAALSMTQLDDHHYGYSSAHYNKFASLSDLLEISLLVLDNADKIPYSGDLETFKDAEFHEMKSLAKELEYTARQLEQLSYNLNDKAHEWVESALLHFRSLQSQQ